MNKEQAIRAVHAVMEGAGFDRSTYPVSRAGEIAIDIWDDVRFSVGMEYGYIKAMLDAFDITEEELG